MNIHYMEKAYKLNGAQIESILDKLVPLIAEPKDYEFFRGVIAVKLEGCTSGEAVLFVSKLLKK